MLVILALIVTVSIPWINKIRRRAELRSAAMEISTTLVAARMKAVKRNVNARVVITPAASVSDFNRITTIEAPPDVVPTPSANLAPDLLISGKTLRFVEAPDGPITFNGAGRRVAPLAPTPGIIVVEGPLGGGPVNQITIDTNAAGRVRVITPVVWQ